MSRSSRIAVWDGWRGLAVLLVLIGHFTFSQWVWEERMGVDVFFVLSGMLMSNILFVERMGLRDFYIRRFSRIMPALVVFLCAALVVSLVLKYEFQLIEFFASLVFIRTYFPVDPQYMSNLIPTGHLWSLSVEEHSYVAMSLLSIIFLLRIRIAWVLLSLFGISVIVNFYHYVNLPLEEFKYSLYRTESAMGFIAFSAGYNLIRDKYSLKVNPYLPILFLVLAFCCYIKWVPIYAILVFCHIPSTCGNKFFTISTMHCPTGKLLDSFYQS